MTIPTSTNVVIPNSTVTAKKCTKKEKSYCRCFVILPFLLGAIVGGFLAFLCFYEVKLAPRYSAKSSNVLPHVERIIQKDIINASNLANNQKPGSNLSVLCVVVMVGKNLRLSDAISDTYGRRCNTTAYYAAEKPNKRKPKKDPIPDSDYTVHLLKNAGNARSWSFQQAMFKHLAQQYNRGYDWIFLCDYNCYAVLENLREFASGFPAERPVAAGHMQTASSPIAYLFPSLAQSQTYLNTDAGYILNNKTFSSLVPAIHGCAGWWYFDDESLTRCLNSLNIPITDAHDWDRGGHRFVPKAPKQAIIDSGLGSDDGWRWYWPFPYQAPEPCCSDRAISFGNMNEKQIHLLDYTLYRLRPYGVNDYYQYDYQG